MTSPFGKPSENEGGNVKASDLEGSLCIFTYKGSGTSPTKKYGDKPYVEVDVDVVRGVPDGTVSKMPPQTFGEQPARLRDLTGVSENGVRLFQGFLRGSFRRSRPDDMVLGTIVVEGRITNQSTNDKDYKASYVLKDATPEDEKLAIEFLRRKQAGQFKSPSASGAPAAANEEPPF